MDINAYFQQQMNEIFNSILMWGIISIIITIAIWVGIIVLICKYLAKQISIKFDYDKLAKRTAEEVCKRILIIEKQKAKAKEIEPEGESSNA